MHRLHLEQLEDRRLLAFDLAVNYPVGEIPVAVVAADFNNDGRLDLATANWLGSSVSVLRGDANGMFQPAQTIAAKAPVSIAAGDFNNDGMLDLVTGDLGGHSVSVLFGNGDATFQPPVSTDVQGGDPDSVAVGDFNADGRLDVAVGTYSYYWGGATGTQVQVLLGNGGGGFTHGDIKSIPYSYNVPLAVADVNGDGRPDVLAASESSMLISVLLTNSDGTLSYITGPSDFATSNHTSGLTVGDFTGDGILDLLAAGYSSVAVLPGQSDGTFAAPIVTVSNHSTQTAVAAGDFDRDGKLDVVVTHDEANGVLTALVGRGDGTFSLVGDQAVGSSPKAVVAGDFNGDGWLDVATANGDFRLDVPNSVSVLLNDLSWQKAPPSTPAVSIDDVSVREGKKGKTTSFTFTVTLSAAYGQPVAMSYSTVDGSATTGDNDYVGKTGTLTFAPGETTKTITISVKGDSKREADETFYLDLFGLSSNALFTKNRGLGTILNDDR